MKTRQLGWIVLLLTALVCQAALASVAPAAAQTYDFAVPELNMQVFVQADGTARIVYDITFENRSVFQPIDIVDIGMPHEEYNLADVTASLASRALTDIRPSEYVHPGVEIHLGTARIGPGQRGTLHVEFRIASLIYEDVTNRDNVSLQITPTWFGEQFVSGDTRLQLAIHMLPGIEPQEILYQAQPYPLKAVFEEHAVAFWEWPSTRLTGPHLVGVSFPRRGLSSGIVSQTVVDLAEKWLEDNPLIRIALALIAIALFAFLFFRFSGRTGVMVFVLLTAALILLMAVSPLAHLISLPALTGLILVNEGHLRQRRLKYLPAVAQVEGGGIKRGLTAPEAAVMLELPLSRVLGLVIFGLLKKRVLRQVNATPLVVEVADEFKALRKSAPANDKRANIRRKAAQAKGIVLHNYENAFLEALEKKPGVAAEKIDFGKAMKTLVQTTAQRMSGFDLSDTQDYYRRIVKRALLDARSVGDIAMREQTIDRNLEWILMDPDHRTVFRSGGFSYRPVWTRPAISAGSGGNTSSGSRPSAGGRTSFSDVAAGFAGWAENTMGNLASAISPTSMGLPSPDGGVVNLSGADKVTGDFFKALSSSSGSGGRGSGSGGRSCACACAGCACACACAGGGR